MTKLNKALMASTAIAFASGLALPASAQDPSAAPGVVKSQNKVKLRLYGQITRVFGWVTDENTSTFKQGSNGNTSTRMGIDGRGKVTKDISLRTRLEFAVNTGDSGGGSQFENQGGSNDFDIRHLDVILSHKKFGALWIGRGDSATNGTSEVDLSGNSTGRLGGSTHHLIGKYRVLGKNDSSVEPSVAGTIDRWFNNFDGAGRQNRIRYDSPTFFGAKASVGVIDKHNFDAALRYGGKFGGTQVKGAVGYCHTKGARTSGDSACFGNGSTIEGVRQFNGSVSVKTKWGVGGTIAGAHVTQNRAGSAHNNEDNPWNINPSIFYTTKVTELGNTTAEYAYQFCKHCGRKGDEGRGHAVTILQKVDSVGGDYFVGFRYFDMNASRDIGNATEPEDVWWIGAGFRQRF